MNRKNHTTHALFHEAHDLYDLLFIQEPWWGDLGGGKHGEVSGGPGWACLLPKQPGANAPRPRVMTHVRRRSDLTITPRPDLANDPDMMFVEVAQPGRRTILVGNIYNQRPLQEGDEDAQDGEAGTYTVERLRRVRLPRDVPVVLVGDWNLHHPWWESMHREPSALATATVEWLRENGFALVNETDIATYYAHGSGKRSVLDLVFVNECAQQEDTVKDFCVDEKATLDSDHCGLRWTFDPAREEVENPTGVRFNWKAADEDKFKAAVLRQADARMDAFEVLRENRRLNVHELERATEALHNVLDAAAREAVPERKSSTQSNPWWNEEMSAAKEQVEAAAVAQSQCKSNDPETRTRLSDTCAHAAAVFKRTAKKVKRHFFRSKLQDAKGSDIWAFPKWTKGRREYPTPPLSRGPNRPPATTHSEKCDALRDTLFAPPPELGHEHPDLDADQEGAETFVEVTRLEVERALLAPDPDSAPGDSGISNRGVRWAWEVIEWIIWKLIAHCARAGYHPSRWRRAIAACLRKLNRKDYSLPRAYRLIALLECLGKVLESIQARRLAHYGVTRGLLPEMQFGGVPGRSVEDAGLTFVHDVENAARSHMATSALTFDITGYFDRVSHPRLLTILHDAKLPEPLVRWVASFLSDRQAAICVDGKIGDMAPVRTGIPQGSPVSPILAAFFSRTLEDRILAAAPRIRASLPARHNPSIGRLIMYVDDGKLYVSSTSLATNVAHLAALFDVAREWAEYEGVILDDDKRDFAHFTASLRKVGRQRVKTMQRPSLRIPDNTGGFQVLQPAQSYRWLGIIWDPQLKFAAHVKRMAERGANAVAALRMLGNTTSGLRPLHLRQIHNACVVPILTFGSLVWFTGRRQKTLIHHLDVVVRRSCRHILGAFKTTPATFLHLEASMPPMDLRLQARQESSAIRLARLDARHPVLRRLGADWAVETECRVPPPLPTRPMQRNGTPTQLQALAAHYPADGERVDAFLTAPWDDALADARWAGRLIVEPRIPGVDKPTCAAAHVARVRTLRASARNVLVYTDGSLLEGRAGAGFAAFHLRRQVTGKEIGLGEKAEVYDGEMRGLEMAASVVVPFASSLPAPAHIFFFADNSAAISQISARRAAAGQIYSVGFMSRIEEFLTQDDAHRVSIAWVPGHEDVAGQEASDVLAKGGTRRASSLPHSTTMTRAKREVKRRLRDRMRERWLAERRRNSYAPANRFPPSLQPTPHLRALDKRTLATLTQCRSGHAFTGEYYRAIDKPERGLGCACGAAIQTRDHILADCPEYDLYRNVLRDVSPVLSITDLLGTREGVVATAKFLRRSGAFGRPTAVDVE